MTQLKFDSLDRETIRKYATNSLSVEEQAAVEEYFFEHPEVLDEVEAELQLAQGMQEAAPARVVASEPKNSWFTRVFGHPMLGLAATSAALVLAILIGLPQEPAATNTPWYFLAAPEDLNLDRFRGGEKVPTLNLPAAGLVRVRVYVEQEVEGHIEIELKGPLDARKIPLQVDKTNFLYLAVDSAVLSAGEYELTVTQHSDKLAHYRFMTVAGE